MYFPVQRKIGQITPINVLLVPVIIAICAFAIVGDGGILHGYSAKIRLRSVSKEVVEVEKQNEVLRRQINLVQENPRIAKQLIAQNTLWVEPNTQVYRFENLETQASAERPYTQGWLTAVLWLGEDLGFLK